MKKSDLRSGMLVLQANGKVKMVLNSTLIAADGSWSSLDNYYEHLQSKMSPNSDIIAVSQRLTGANLSTSNWTLNTVGTWLYWKHKSCTYITAEPETRQQSEKTFAVIDGKEYTKEEFAEGVVNIIRTL